MIRRSADRLPDTREGRVDAVAPIGVAAREAGVAASTLRYWERRGLIAPAARRSGQRRYGAEDMHRIALIKMWRETGLMSIDDIGVLLSAGTGDQWRHAVRRRVAAIERQQQLLAGARMHLLELLTCPDDDPARDCPVLRGHTGAGRRSQPGQISD